MIAVIPKRVAADMKSPAIAKPLETPPILPPATKKSSALEVLFDATNVSPTVPTIITKKRNIPTTPFPLL